MHLINQLVTSGTLSLDVIRGAQFSSISDAQGREFPNAAPKGGWIPFTRQKELTWDSGWDHAAQPNQKGMAAFGYRQMLCWLDELKPIIAMDIPAIILMEYGDYPHDGLPPPSPPSICKGSNQISKQDTFACWLDMMTCRGRWLCWIPGKEAPRRLYSIPMKCFAVYGIIPNWISTLPISPTSLRSLYHGRLR